MSKQSYNHNETEYPPIGESQLFVFFFLNSMHFQMLLCSSLR